VRSGFETGINASVAKGFVSALWGVSIGAVCYVSLIPRVEFPLDFEGADLVYHALAYLWLSFLPFFVFGTGKRGLLAAFLMIPLGIILELGQTFVPGRTFSILDMVANSCGTILGTLCGKYVRGVIGTIMKL
jgi:hypothetical protein